MNTKLREPLTAEEEAELRTDDDEALTRVVSHPDGYYWIADDGHQQFGPFETLSQALADMGQADGGDGGSALALSEVEDELGMADWIDPETGAPAEQTPPRLEEH